MTHPPPDIIGELVAAQDHLVAATSSGVVGSLSDMDLLELMRQLEVARNRQGVVDNVLIAECEARDLPQRLAHTSTARMLVDALQLSPFEANRRVRAAEACGPRLSFTGEPMEPMRPAVARAQAAGTASAEQVDLIIRALAPYDRPGFDPADVAAGEVLLAGWTEKFAPPELKILCNRVVTGIDPDGTRPDDDLNAARRHFTIRATKDGGYTGEFRLTGEVGAKLMAVLDPLSRPRITRVGLAEAVVNGNVSTASGVMDVDSRTLPQRRHDAVEDVCDRLLGGDSLPDSGGTPATVIVTIDYDDLVSRTGCGTTSDGVALSVAAILRLAEQADVVPTVLNKSGAVLDLGRSRRIASPAQTCALIARDGCCSFPGCDHPPQYCERLHVIAWIDGGPTDLNNLTLLCRYHHRYFETRGWECEMTASGLPQWRPPAWIDPQRRPLANARITATNLARLRQPDLALIT